MAIFFSVNELLEIALAIERNGLAFYQALANRTQNVEAKVIYDYLASEERKHIELFQKMQNAFQDYQLPENYPGEYQNYLKALVNSHIFTSVEEAVAEAKKAPEEIYALDKGIQTEKDSILFYTEMQNLIRVSDQPIIQKIIEEEKAHLRQLTELKAIIAKKKK